jgi:hypothetical protein
MPNKDQVIEQIRKAFGENEFPGEVFLQGSFEGCEAGEVTAPFRKLRNWQDVDAALLDANYSALSFFTEAGFRFFLPAFLIADLQERLQTADPLFHLTNGFQDSSVKLCAGGRVFEKKLGRLALLNPRRYGAMTFLDYARCRLSIFAREEAQAIVSYPSFKRNSDPDGIHQEEINSALDSFWLDRAAHAPTQDELRRCVEDENSYIKAISSEAGRPDTNP